MKYFAQIQAYFSGKMTEVEGEAFEHEVMDNVDLANEMDAYQTGTDLLDFAAGNLSDGQILGSEKQKAPSKAGREGRNFSYWTVGIFLVVAVGLLLFVFLGSDDQNRQKTAPAQPVEEKEQPAKKRPIAEAPSQPLLLPAGEQGQLSDMPEAKEIKEVTDPPAQIAEIKKPSSKPTTRSSDVLAKLTTEKTKTATQENSASTELTSDALIASGEAIVYQASRQITLTPGFHAKAGSSVRAVLKKD